MLIHEKSHNRPVELGTYPREALAKDPSIIEREAQRPSRLSSPYVDSDKLLAKISNNYSSYLGLVSQGETASQKAPVPDSLERRSADVKGAA